MPGVKRSADSQAANRVQHEPPAKRAKVAQSKSAGEVPRVVAQRAQVRSAFGPIAQLAGGLEEELPAQGKGIAQRAGMEDELPLQGKTIQREEDPSVLADAAEEISFASSEKAEKKLGERVVPNTAQRQAVTQRAGVEEESPLQGKGIMQMAGAEEELPAQGKGIAQLAGMEEEELLQGKDLGKTVQKEEKPNKTGMPDNLKSGVESLSGMAMDDVRVHYNSAQPSQLNALAYAQGNDIHVGSGQEKHLPHEAWHVVQQAQGRVKPTMQMKSGVSVNDDAGLEQEADVMGAKALQTKPESDSA